MNNLYPVSGNLALKPLASSPRFTVVPGRCPVPRQSVPAASPAPSRVGSARRALCVAIACVGVCFVLFAAALFTQQHAFDAALSSSDRTVVQVDTGDTLWDIAQAHAVKGLSVHDTVNVIRAWNHLDSGVLQPGMDLAVPLVSE